MTIETVDFDSRLHDRMPVELLDRHELLRRVDPARLGMPQRPRFHILILMGSDKGSHAVDFVEIEARKGRMIHVRPGQVQVWNTKDDFEATVVLAQAMSTSAKPWFSGHASYCDLEPGALAVAKSLVDALTYQQNRFSGDAPGTDFMVSMFDGLSALFDQASDTRETSEFPPAYTEFRDAIEQDLTRHDVVDYARELGYSPRTLTRACQRATGQSAKRVLADRLVLEAMRLLAHTDLTAAAISSQLGFSEPTNFTKFFVSNTGVTPSAFRKSDKQTV